MFHVFPHSLSHEGSMWKMSVCWICLQDAGHRFRGPQHRQAAPQLSDCGILCHSSGFELFRRIMTTMSTCEYNDTRLHVQILVALGNSLRERGESVMRRNDVSWNGRTIFDFWFPKRKRCINIYLFYVLIELLVFVLIPRLWILYRNKHACHVIFLCKERDV